ncbi:MAG TPA: PQQ-dependent sugar dehydrogenase, partial [Pyrinomonadaceae bacterium]|nr:PQQ-dependent sugar dehydrogenase [Pyrinomonadaceae bacterium]
SPNPGQVGLGLSYRITATNNGPAAATNVTVTDTLPGGVAFVSATSTQGSCSGTGPINCNLGSLTVGASAIVTIVVTPSSPGQITNSATVSATESDFDSTNNTASTTTVIQSSAASPVMLDDNLTVSTVISGLDQPTSMAFIGPNDFLVLERATGKVQRIVNGGLHSTPLDLAVNNASERGLLGIALHQKFSQNGFVYLFWTESSTGTDTANVDQVALLGNRVDRYVWNGSTLTLDRNLIKLRSLQPDAGQPSRGNHNGGVVRVGPDGKVYIIFGDNGRRGFLQNITSGGPVPDDQFGGPEPDDAHLTGVVLRLNDDGSTPNDNPFFDVTTNLTGEAAANIKKVFAYGIRNSFGMDFDPLSGALWTQENGDDAFDEINRVTPGFNGGWIQTMGPVSRVDQFRSIEMTYGAGNLQQLRWPPSNIASTPQQAVSRMFMLPGAQYLDPEFSWKYALAPSPIGFVRGRGLGPQFEGDLFVGASRTTLLNGFLFRFKLTADRQHFSFSDPRLADRVADNTDKFDQTESESLLIGRDFGITTDIQTGPNGNLFVVSLSNGAVYEIKSKPSLLFTATLNGAQETPPNNSTATGRAALLLSPDEKTGRVSVTFSSLSSTQTDAHIHGPAAPGVSAAPVFPLPLGQISDFQITLTPSQVQDLKNGLFYVNVHSSNFPAGEIRGQFGLTPPSSSIQFNATRYLVGEGAGGVTVSVTRIGNTSNPVTINYATSNGTAQTPTDYTSASGALQFAAGETVKTFVVPIIDDGMVEITETINLVLSSPGAGGVEGSPFTSTITVFDDDKPMLLLEENTSRAVAVDSFLLMRDPFRLTNIHNLSLDQRTRIMLFATGIDSRDAPLLVQVQLEDTQNRIYHLVVEDMRQVPNFDFSQIVVKLPDSIDTEGDFQVRLVYRSTVGNKALIRIFR